MAQTFFGPSPYLQTSDSPLASLNGFTFDTLEDGLLNIPGVSADTGAVIGPSSITDSVDGDDGVIDGSGNGGNSWFSSSGGTGVTFTFNAAQIGFAPKSAGIVWTDGLDPITFEAFDTNGNSLGTLTGNHADNSFFGGTAEDRFYGISFAGGIGSIKISSSAGAGIEVDHIQYAADETPEPTSIALLSVAGFFLAGCRTKR